MKTKPFLPSILSWLFIASLAALIALAIALMPYLREIGAIKTRLVFRGVAIVGSLIVAWIFKGWVSTTDEEFSISGFLIRIMGFAFFCWLLYMPMRWVVGGMELDKGVMVGSKLNTASPGTNLILFRVSPVESATLNPEETREVMTILREGKPRKTTSTSPKAEYYLMMPFSLSSRVNHGDPVQLDSESQAINARFPDEDAERLAQIILSASGRLKSVK